MEHYRTRSVRHPRGQVPRQQAPGAARPAGTAPARRRLPRPRLTGLGGGLFACVAMAVVAGIVWLLFDASLFAYGLLFLPVAATTALWVRPADLITAPISAPIAFAVGVWPVSGGSGGIGGQLMGIVSALSLHAGWLYAGTVLAALIALVRKAVLIGKRRMPRRVV